MKKITSYIIVAVLLSPVSVFAEVMSFDCKTVSKKTGKIITYATLHNIESDVNKTFDTSKKGWDSKATHQWTPTQLRIKKTAVSREVSLIMEHTFTINREDFTYRYTVAANGEIDHGDAHSGKCEIVKKSKKNLF